MSSQRRNSTRFFAIKLELTRDASGEADGGSQLVEGPFTSWSTGSHEVKTDARETHDGGNDPLELVSVVGDVDVGTELFIYKERVGRHQ